MLRSTLADLHQGCINWIGYECQFIWDSMDLDSDRTCHRAAFLVLSPHLLLWCPTLEYREPVGGPVGNGRIFALHASVCPSLVSFAPQVALIWVVDGYQFYGSVRFRYVQHCRELRVSDWCYLIQAYQAVFLFGSSIDIILHSAQAFLNCSPAWKAIWHWLLCHRVSLLFVRITSTSTIFSHFYLNTYFCVCITWASWLIVLGPWVYSSLSRVYLCFLSKYFRVYAFKLKLIQSIICWHWNLFHCRIHPIETRLSSLGELGHASLYHNGGGNRQERKGQGWHQAEE